MNSDRPTQIVPWERLTQAGRETYLREANEFVSQSVAQGGEAEIAPEDFDDAVRQTARDIYYETQAAQAAETGPSHFTQAAIEEQARRVSAALHKRVFAYRHPAGLLVLAAAPLPEAAHLVAAYDKGRKIALNPKEIPRLGIPRGQGQRISL